MKEVGLEKFLKDRRELEGGEGEEGIPDGQVQRVS